jgi:hypothetical protein
MVMHYKFNPSNAELKPVFHLLALLGAHHILHVSRIRVNLSTYVQEPMVRGRRVCMGRDLNEETLAADNGR